MNKPRLTHLILMAAITVAAAPVTHAQQPKGKTEETKSTTARSRGADENIKTAKPTTNSENANVPAPANKAPGRSKGASAVATVVLDNSTPWYIDIYIDGSYRGTMGPWGDSYAYALAGNTRLYARADFDNGSYKFWGPKVVYIGNGESFTWRILP